MWRYSGNPIIGRNGNKVSNSVFNSAVVPFAEGYAGVFRCDSRSISMDIYAGRSKDGIHWEIEDEPIEFEGVICIGHADRRPIIAVAPCHIISVLQKTDSRIITVFSFQYFSVGAFKFYRLVFNFPMDAVFAPSSEI